MKRLFFVLLTSVIATSAAFAQYPLPSTQVYGDLTVDSAFYNEFQGFEIKNDTFSFIADNPFAGSLITVGSGAVLNGVGDFSGVGNASQMVIEGFISLPRVLLLKIDTTTVNLQRNVGDTIIGLQMLGGYSSVDQIYKLEGSIGKGNSGFEGQVENGKLAAKMYATDYTGGTNLSVVKLDTTYIKLQTDNTDVIFDMNDSEFSMESTQALFYPPRMTSTQAGNITAANGAIVYVTNTDATFTSIGFWGYVNGTWEKLD